jgi:hypothetical protein
MTLKTNIRIAASILICAFAFFTLSIKVNSRFCFWNSMVSFDEGLITKLKSELALNGFSATNSGEFSEFVNPNFQGGRVRILLSKNAQLLSVHGFWNGNLPFFSSRAQEEKTRDLQSFFRDLMDESGNMNGSSQNKR